MHSFTTPWRISGIAGLLFVALSFLASGMNVQPPAYDQDEAAFVAWFAENGHRFRAGHFVAGLAFLLFSPAAGTTSGAFLVGVALLGGRVSPEVAVFGTAANFYAFVVSGAMSGIILIGAAVVILRTGVFRRWLGWAGAWIGFAAIGGSAALVENDPSGLFATVNASAWLAYFLWIAALSIELMRARNIPRKA